MRAYCLILVKSGSLSVALEGIRAIVGEEIQVDEVAGTYDIVVVLEGEKPEKIGDMVVNKIQHMEGVASTVTLLAIG